MFLDSRASHSILNKYTTTDAVVYTPLVNYIIYLNVLVVVNFKITTQTNGPWLGKAASITPSSDKAVRITLIDSNSVTHSRWN